MIFDSIGFTEPEKDVLRYLAALEPGVLDGHGVCTTAEAMELRDYVARGMPRLRVHSPELGTIYALSRNIGEDQAAALGMRYDEDCDVLWTINEQLTAIIGQVHE